ncbi:MAG: hypothetical protein GX139_03250 [Armatimonadetes bacterium]|jgi:hypothetical protein|nr:hypothetical protein [Armatimonadota bacterium]
MESQTGPEIVEQEKPRGVRARVWVAILILQAAMIYWAVDSEVARGIFLVCYSIMMPTAMYLLLARAFRRWLPFRDYEIILIYIVLTATIPIIGFGGLRFVITGMGFLPFFSESMPQWSRYLPALKAFPVLQNLDAVQQLYKGGYSVPWRAWIVPIGFWSVYLMLLSVIWICLAGILRRIWIDQERLTFPIAQMPLEIMNPKQDIFKKPLFWIGFAVPVILQSLLVFHNWFPAVPAMQLKAYDIKPLIFTSPPWDAIPNVPIGFYPMGIGLAYFVPSDVSLSCWLMAVLMRLSYVGAAIFGVEAAGTGASRFPYKEEQACGAWLALAGLVIWGARHHWRTVLEMVSQSEQRAVRMMIKVATLCTIICIGMMVATGIPLLAASIVFIVYLAYVLSGARVRAEAGAIWTFAPLGMTPSRTMTTFIGANGLNDRALVANGHFNLVHWDIRAQSLPFLMEGMDIAEKSGIDWKIVMKLVAIGTITALAIGWWSTLEKVYRLGAATAKANAYPLVKTNQTFTEVDRVATQVKSWDPSGVAAVALSAAFTVALAWMRRIGLFGLHPIGYVMCNSLIMNAFILPFFIAWLVKTIVLRFGGNKAYRTSVAFFVGVILGDVVIQGAWALFGWIFSVPIYQFLT